MFLRNLCICFVRLRVYLRINSINNIKYLSLLFWTSNNDIIYVVKCMAEWIVWHSWSLLVGICTCFVKSMAYNLHAWHTITNTEDIYAYLYALKLQGRVNISCLQIALSSPITLSLRHCYCLLARLTINCQ